MPLHLKNGRTIHIDGRMYRVSNLREDDGTTSFTATSCLDPLHGAWKAALEAARGNISQAGAALGFTRDRSRYLTERFNMADYANELRIKAGGTVTVEGKHEGRATGRPRKKW